jgi:hypothetical protein
MPVKEKLPDEQIADFVSWIKMARPDPRIASATPVTSRPAVPSLSEARKFWAFQPARETMPPIVRTAWGRTPIDNFILARSRRRRCPRARSRPADAAAPRDGRPHGPAAAPEEIDAFLKDESPDAYEKVVDRLLGLAPIRRAVGPPLAGRRPLRRHEGVGRRRGAPAPLPVHVPRLGHQGAQRRPAVRPFLQLQIAADRLVTGDDKSDLAALGFLTVGRSFLNRQARSSTTAST